MVLLVDKHAYLIGEDSRMYCTFTVSTDDIHLVLDRLNSKNYCREVALSSEQTSCLQVACLAPRIMSSAV